MAQFRPAGMSDEDSDSDEYRFFEKPSRSYIPVPPLNLRKKLENNLQDAIVNGNLKEVEKIVICDLGNDVDTKLESGWTALLHACFHGQDKIVAFLLEKGADPNIHADTVTPIMLACSNNSASNDAIKNIVVNLIQKGCIVNVGDRYGHTPLMRAISTGRIASVQKLLDHDINIEMRDKQGWTALFWASHNNQPEVLEMLMAKGARLTEVDRIGRTALHIAESHDYGQVVEMLKAAMPEHEEPQQAIETYYSSQPGTWHDYYPGIIRARPDYKCEIGQLLYGMNCERLIPLILDSDLDLRTFLLLEEHDMKKLGVEMPYERQRLKIGLRNFHTRGWKLNAVAGLYSRKSANYTVIDCLTTLGTHLQQTYILEATLQYALREYSKIQNQIKFEPPDSPVMYKLKVSAKKMVTNINNIKKEVNSMKIALSKISKSNPLPADLIKEKTIHDILYGYFSEALVVCSLGLVVFYGRRYVTNLLNK